MFRRLLLPWIVWIFYRAWAWTWRIECLESQAITDLMKAAEPVIFAHWHGDELCIVPLVTRYKIATMTSTSKDGQLIDFVIHRLKGATSRGSATRGGSRALMGLVRLVRQGYRASMAVDGPKGPLHKVKPGVFALSRIAGARIIPVGTACSRAIVFRKSWNQARLPKPFARVVVFFGEPWSAMPKEGGEEDSRWSARLEGDLSNACQTAADHLR